MSASPLPTTTTTTTTSTSVSAVDLPSASVEEPPASATVTAEGDRTSSPPPPGVDPDVWSFLPSSIRQELREEHAREAARATTSGADSITAGGGEAQDMDFPSIIASITDREVRLQALESSTDEQIASLPANLRAEAAEARERSEAARAQFRQQQPQHQQQNLQRGQESEDGSSAVSQETYATIIEGPGLSLSRMQADSMILLLKHSSISRLRRLIALLCINSSDRHIMLPAATDAALAFQDPGMDIKQTAHVRLSLRTVLRDLAKRNPETREYFATRISDMCGALCMHHLESLKDVSAQYRTLLDNTILMWMSECVTPSSKPEVVHAASNCLDPTWFADVICSNAALSVPQSNGDAPNLPEALNIFDACLRMTSVIAASSELAAWRRRLQSRLEEISVESCKAVRDELVAFSDSSLNMPWVDPGSHFRGTPAERTLQRTLVVLNGLSALGEEYDPPWFDELAEVVSECMAKTAEKLAQRAASEATQAQETAQTSSESRNLLSIRALERRARLNGEALLSQHSSDELERRFSPFILTSVVSERFASGEEDDVFVTAFNPRQREAIRTTIRPRSPPRLRVLGARLVQALHPESRTSATHDDGTASEAPPAATSGTSATTTLNTTQSAELNSAFESLHQSDGIELPTHSHDALFHNIFSDNVFESMLAEEAEEEEDEESEEDEDEDESEEDGEHEDEDDHEGEENDEEEGEESDDDEGEENDEGMEAVLHVETHDGVDAPEEVAMHVESEQPTTLAPVLVPLLTRPVTTETTSHQLPALQPSITNNEGSVSTSSGVFAFVGADQSGHGDAEDDHRVRASIQRMQEMFPQGPWSQWGASVPLNAFESEPLDNATSSRRSHRAENQDEFEHRQSTAHVESANVTLGMRATSSAAEDPSHRAASQETTARTGTPIPDLPSPSLEESLTGRPLTPLPLSTMSSLLALRSAQRAAETVPPSPASLEAARRVYGARALDTGSAFDPTSQPSNQGPVRRYPLTRLRRGAVVRGMAGAPVSSSESNSMLRYVAPIHLLLFAANEANSSLHAAISSNPSTTSRFATTTSNRNSDSLQAESAAEESDSSVLRPASPMRRAHSPGMAPEATGSPRYRLKKRLEKFCLSNADYLNQLVRTKPRLLNAKTNFSLIDLALNPFCRGCLTFDVKAKYFKECMKQLVSDMHHQRGQRGIRLNVSRSRVFEDSLTLNSYTKADMFGRITVKFNGEEGVDAGGVQREWYQILVREIFKPDYALFKPGTDSPAFQPDSRSSINPDHLMYFQFVGRIFGKALIDDRLINAHFTRSFYKHLLNREIVLKDLESMDPTWFNSLITIVQSDEATLEVLDLRFTADVEEFGARRTVELKPNGSNLPVTMENKSEYARLCAHRLLTSSIEAQINAFKKGFHELVPVDCLQVFNPEELELLMCGLPEIDIDDLEKNTVYHRGFDSSSSEIVWFWKVIREFSKEDKARFLQFVTGTSLVPLDGFAGLIGMRGVQPFSIFRAQVSDEVLPTAHTCFNQLDLPVYSSLEVLREKLLVAFREGSEGFGFG